MEESKYAKDIIQRTIQIIQIPSVKSEPTEEAPFGKDILKVLETTLELCHQLGMRTTNIQNKVGYAEYGAGKEEIGILVHLDVVPVHEEEWEYPPFQGVIAEDRIYGRGALDDKGPAVAAIYAVKRLMDELEQWNKRIRIIFFTDEESSWADVPVYLENEKESTFAFSPDANFPLIYAEKGVLHLELTISNSHDWLIAFSGGSRPNIVPDLAVIQLSNELKEILEIPEETQRIIKKFQGVAAHGSLPEKGDNAIVQSLEYLSEIESKLGEKAVFGSLYELFKDYHGKGLGMNFHDDASGLLTFNVGQVRKEAQEIVFSVDIRYPVTYKKQQILDHLSLYFSNIKEIFSKAPLYHDLKEENMKKLLEAYHQVTGDADNGIPIGGATLARAFKNAVAFGPLFIEDEENAHMSNEYISIESLLKAHEVYYVALKKLLEA